MKNIIIFLFLSHGIFAQQSQNVTLLYNWKDSTLTDSIPVKYNEVWGFSINNKEFAVIGSYKGTHILDVTDPINTYQTVFIPGKGGMFGWNVIHRDYHDFNGYLYMVSDEDSIRFQIADLKYLPDSVVIVHESDSLIFAHNIFIDTATAKLYVCNGGLRVYSLTTPVLPEFLTLGFSSGGHDVYVRNDTAYLNAEYDFLFGGLRIIDFTDTTGPQLIGSLFSYPDKGYNHSGWLSGDGNIYVFADEGHGDDLKICDVSDPTNITVLSTINAGFNADSSTPHNPIIKDNYIYCSYYHDGLQIIDISNPLAPVRVGYYDTYIEESYYYFEGAWGVYPFLPSGNVLVSDMENGLFIFDVSQAITGEREVNYDSNSIYVYPNPARDLLTIKIMNIKTKDTKIKILDINGRKIFSHNLVNYSGNYIKELNTSKLSKGLYTVQVIFDDEIITKKILIN